jgi:hypothetical protein
MALHAESSPASTGVSGRTSALRMKDQRERHWFKREGDRFIPTFKCPENLRPDFESMTAELVDYRLARYAKTRIERVAELSAGRFVAKVSHSGG